MAKDSGGTYGGFAAPKLETHLIRLAMPFSVPYGLLVLLAVLGFFPGSPISFLFAVVIAIATVLLGAFLFVYPHASRGLRKWRLFRQLALASDMYATEEQLDKLSKSQFPEVRIYVAHNFSTPVPVLVNLFEDVSLSVREVVGTALLARIDTLPKDLLLDIASGKTPLAKSAAKDFVKSRRISAVELEHIVATSVAAIRWGAVSNRNINFATILKLLKDPDWFVRKETLGVVEKMSLEKFEKLVSNSEYSYLAGLPSDWVLKSLNVLDVLTQPLPMDMLVSALGSPVVTSTKIKL